MTRTSLRSLRIILTAFIVGCTATLVGCGSFGPVTPVAVSDIEAVTGTWKGIVYLSSESEPDHIMLTIREDGSYDVRSTREPMGTSRGRGRIVVTGGRLIIEGEKGRGEGRVQRDPAGNLMMEIDATMSDNSTLSASLSRMN